MNTKHETTGMTYAEKVERCRQWLPDGKFLIERGSQFKPRPQTVLDAWRRYRTSNIA